VQRLALALAILIASALLGFRPVYEPDLGWHLAHGRENAAGRLVRSNVFSADYADYRQLYTSWLSETAAYAAWATGGDAGVQSLIALTLAATLALIYSACRAGAATLPSLAILLVSVMVIEPRAIPRPHVASFLGMAACAFLIQRAVRARSVRPLTWAPLVVALWSNAHIECIFGVALLGVFAAGEAIVPSALTRRQALGALAIVAVCVPATLANPYGIGVIRYVHENSSVPQLLAIAELRPAYWPQYRAFFIYLALAAVVIAVPVKRLVLWEVASAILFAALGWRYLRLTPLVVFATAPMIAARLTALSSPPSTSSRSGSDTSGRWRLDPRAIFVTALALALVMSRAPLASFVAGVRVGDLHPRSIFPPDAIAFAREQGLNGPVFNSNNLGGWIEWALYPGVRTFQDSRLQAYPPEHFRRILEASRSQVAWDALVADVDWAMLSTPRPNALSGVGRFPMPQWATVFWDEAVEIVVRRGGRFTPLADAREYRLLRPGAELFEIAPRLTSPDVDQLRAEAARNRRDNPAGFVAAAVVCLAGAGTPDRDRACADAERLGSTDPTLDDDLALLHVLRAKQ
jgi:hypothetical protein